MPAQPARALPGIDVSHWQGTIDWAAVAVSGQRFAIAKATEGRTLVDSTYVNNKFGAQANGITFGAYHFAQPDDSAGDAIAEADHFVDTAQLLPGNLIPVLDLERTGGLSPAELTTWILTWLGRVTERLGVRPMVYTSPAGWENRTGDTTAVVEAGYDLLWIAHWGVAEPRLPAGNWGGHGWTFWQYSSCGSVPGIEGCVDVDWYASSDLAAVMIPNPDVQPPTATIRAPLGVADPLVVSFNEGVRQVRPTNVFVLSTTTGAPLDAAATCRSRTGAAVDCSTGTVRTVEVHPVNPLVPGESYEGVVNPPGVPFPVVDRNGNAAPPTALPFAPSTAVEQDDSSVTAAWATVADRRAVGRSYLVERSAGATASFSFVGRSVTWVTVAGPDQGRAAVWIDGVRRGAFDQHSTRPSFGVERTFGGLARGPHTIAIRVLGTASPGATDTKVVVDAFVTPSGTIRTPTVAASWGTIRASRASGGAVAASDLADASISFTFRGTGVDWTTVRDRRQGRAAVYLDGMLLRTVNNYAAEPTFGVVRSIDGLEAGLHTLRIVVLGESRRVSKGTFVSVDRLEVRL
ncbi:MAG TPA: glycoside hydrolase family 25 protein [Actinomycetota bacterium]|nr:glycoside hydrolase family 25 protein [Actinomycetota bacterium]